MPARPRLDAFDLFRPGPLFYRVVVRNRPTDSGVSQRRRGQRRGLPGRRGPCLSSQGKRGSAGFAGYAKSSRTPGSSTPFRICSCRRSTVPRFPGRHEGRFPSYGAIVVEDGVRTSEVDRSLEAVGATRLDSGPLGHETVGRMADGIHSFALVRRSQLSLVLLASDVLREVELVQLRRVLGVGVSIVSRSVEGVVRVVQDRQIVTFDGTAWWSKPDAHEYAAFVSSAIPNVPTELAEHILDFCVHVAGPGVAGADADLVPRPERGDHARPCRGRHRSAAARSALVRRRQVASADLAPAGAHRRRVPPEFVRTAHPGRPPPARIRRCVPVRPSAVRPWHPARVRETMFLRRSHRGGLRHLRRRARHRLRRWPSGRVHQHTGCRSRPENPVIVRASGSRPACSRPGGSRAAGSTQPSRESPSKLGPTEALGPAGGDSAAFRSPGSGYSSWRAQRSVYQ